MWASGWLSGALAAALLLWTPAPAAADWSGHERGYGHGPKHGHKQGRKPGYFTYRDVEPPKWRGRHRAHGHVHRRAPAYAGSDDLALVLTGVVVGLLIHDAHADAAPAVVQPSLVQVLDRAPDGQTITWADPRSEARYAVAPTRTYREDDGRYCREYLSTATIGGEVRQVYGRACRQPDRAWEIVR